MARVQGHVRSAGEHCRVQICVCDVRRRRRSPQSRCSQTLLGIRKCLTELEVRRRHVKRTSAPDPYSNHTTCQLVALEKGFTVPPPPPESQTQAASSTTASAQLHRHDVGSSPQRDKAGQLAQRGLRVDLRGPHTRGPHLCGRGPPPTDIGVLTVRVWPSSVLLFTFYKGGTIDKPSPA